MTRKDHGEGFDVGVKPGAAHKYKTMPDPTKSPTSKGVFGTTAQMIQTLAFNTFNRVSRSRRLSALINSGGPSWSVELE